MRGKEIVFGMHSYGSRLQTASVLEGIGLEASLRVVRASEAHAHPSNQLRRECAVGAEARPLSGPSEEASRSWHRLSSGRGRLGFPLSAASVIEICKLVKSVMASVRCRPWAPGFISTD